MPPVLTQIGHEYRCENPSCGELFTCKRSNQFYCNADCQVEANKKKKIAHQKEYRRKKREQRNRECSLP